MSSPAIVNQLVATLLSHERTYQPRDSRGDLIMGERCLDAFYLADRRRVWCKFTGESMVKKVFPKIREEPFLVVGNISIEDDNSTTFNAVTVDGQVIRSRHPSCREIDIVRTEVILEAPRLLLPEEISALGDLLKQAN